MLSTAMPSGARTRLTSLRYRAASGSSTWVNSDAANATFTERSGAGKRNSDASMDPPGLYSAEKMSKCSNSHWPARSGAVHAACVALQAWAVKLPLAVCLRRSNLVRRGPVARNPLSLARAFAWVARDQGLRAATREARWRLLGRVGRALVGGRLAQLDAAV